MNRVLSKWKGSPGKNRLRLASCLDFICDSHGSFVREGSCLVLGDIILAQWCSQPRTPGSWSCQEDTLPKDENTH